MSRGYLSSTLLDGGLEEPEQSTTKPAPSLGRALEKGRASEPRLIIYRQRPRLFIFPSTQQHEPPEDMNRFSDVVAMARERS